MALTPDKRCNVCKAIKREAARNKDTLLNRIYHSKQFVKGGETITAIQEDYKDEFSYLSLHKHCKNHQIPDGDEYATIAMKSRAKKIERTQANKIYKHQDLTDEIIQRVAEGIEKGDIKLNAGHGIAASRLKVDVEEKQKDRGLKMMEMIAAFQSGEVKRFNLPEENERSAD